MKKWQSGEDMKIKKGRIKMCEEKSEESVCN